MSQKKGNRWTRMKSKMPKLKDEQIKAYKLEIVRLLDTLSCMTLADAARTLGLSPSQVYEWRQSDEVFKEHCKHTEEILADKIQLRLIDVDKEQRNVAYVTANIFLLKGLRPQFKDSWKVIEPPDASAKEFLAEMVRLAKEEKKEEPKPEEPENPLQDTVARMTGDNNEV